MTITLEQLKAEQKRLASRIAEFEAQVRVRTFSLPAAGREAW